MEFRPCIDIHNGQVKQIVGSSLRDENDSASENFVSKKGADYYAGLYKEANLRGGHIILLNSKDSPYYAETKRQALLALSAFPGGMQIGGGIDADNAYSFIEAGASHVIVTSYVFREGRIDYERLNRLVEAVGKEHIVLDCSCKKTEQGYFIVTDRWQNMTRECVCEELLQTLSRYADEFLIHAVDVEGKNRGIETELVAQLAKWEGIPITYAGGIHSFEDLELLKKAGNGRIHATVGSALDLFGGNLNYLEVAAYCK